jgi:(p)ppGpp synthase/HD superfamily hydrolase
LIARQLVAFEKLTKQKHKKVNSNEARPLTIKGTEGMVVSFPKCCYPIPGDPIHGFITSGRGIVVHRQSCKNIAEYQNHLEKWVHVEWEANIKREFRVRISMNASNQRGVLATVSSTISDAAANIVNVVMKDRDDRYTTLRFIIEVKDRVHLANVMRKIRSLKSISQISRS